jgi:SAM-dependent methyltransferase
MIRDLARSIANSPILARGRSIWEKNQTSWSMPLTRWEKLFAGGYLILSDFSKHQFPPTFADQQKAYDAEINYRDTLPGQPPEASSQNELCKPFWFGKLCRTYLQSVIKIISDLERLQIAPPARLLELGCGAGWLSQILAEMNFDVVGTTIAPADVADAQLRIASLKAKRQHPKLEFRTAPMESIHEAVADLPPFDAAFVFEALHHAYDWRRSLESAVKTLRPGGWLLILNEPNLAHTFVSYRIARLSDTHEIGLHRPAMARWLREVGCTDIRVLRHHAHFWIRSHWIAAQKST